MKMWKLSITSIPKKSQLSRRDTCEFITLLKRQLDNFTAQHVKFNCFFLVLYFIVFISTPFQNFVQPFHTHFYISISSTLYFVNISRTFSRLNAIELLVNLN